MDKGNTEDFWNNDTVIVDTCPCVFVQTHRMYKTKREHDENYALCVIWMCQSRFIR